MRSENPRLQVALLTLLSCGFTAMIILSALWLAPHRASLLFLGTLALVSLGLLLIVPVQVLPLIALLLLFTVSDRIADASLFPILTPATAVLLVWLCRKLLSASRHVSNPEPKPRPLRLQPAVMVCSVLLAGWLVVLLAVSPTRLGISWSITYFSAVVAPLFVADTRRESHLLLRALPWLGGVTAVYAVLQGMLHNNFIYNPILSYLGQESVAQHWAVYRSDGSFGHPLIAGLFFAVVLAVCVGRWLESRQVVFLLLGLVNGLGIIATVSRGSYIAAGGAVAAVFALALLSRGRFSRPRLLLMLTGCALFAYLAVHTSSFLDRGASQEALDSAEVRANLPAITYQAARSYHWLGSGPATSLIAAAPFNFQGLRIENSYFQALISLGIPGLVLFSATLGLITVLAVQRGNLGAAAGVIALAIGLSGFAALDGSRNVVILLGLLMMMALHTPAGAAPRMVVPDQQTSRKAHVAHHWT